MNFINLTYKINRLKLKSIKNSFIRRFSSPKKHQTYTYNNEALIIDLCSTTNLTREDINEWYNGFMRDCPNGRLDLAQFEKYYKELIPDGHTKKYARFEFMAHDKDNSGYIEFDEFITVIAKLSSKNVKDRFDLVFEMCDVDHNGVIDREEAFKIIKSVYKVSGEDVEDRLVSKHVNELFEVYDRDSNGVLTKDEFINGCLNSSDIKNLVF